MAKSGQAGAARIYLAMKSVKPSPKPSPLLIGAHMSIAGGVARAIDRALSVDCAATQIFVKNNMQWFAAAPFADAELKAFHKHPRRAELRSVFGHSGYLINLSAVNPEFAEKSRRALAEELARADQLALPFLVLHPGAHMGAGEAEGLAKIVAGLDTVLESLPYCKTCVALETTAGQGTSLGHTFEQLAWILEHSAHPDRLCVCVDTAHLFAAGYDISTESGAQKTFERFDRVVGLNRLVAVHCNDSKTGLGSRVDRHEHLGKGKIGLAPFRFLMQDRRFASIPKVLETPKGEALAEDVVNLGVLRELA